jgi:hypothetical protein
VRIFQLHNWRSLYGLARHPTAISAAPG